MWIYCKHALYCSLSHIRKMALKMKSFVLAAVATHSSALFWPLLVEYFTSVTTMHHQPHPLSVPLHPLGPRVSLLPSSLLNSARLLPSFALGMDLGFPPSEVTAHLLHAARAMALLVANVDTNIIQLMGWWCSNKLLWYLHLTAEPITKTFASPMLHAYFSIIPSQLVSQ